MSAQDAAASIQKAFGEIVVEQPQEQPQEPPPCPFCGGDGWYIGHEDECYDTGDCNCSGVQIQCECQEPARG